ncbi:hypothetical protein Mapa_014853 [Marchantia paleacea]|nr:hypothetical protein Mapa_014853 [Marchantia paleacea]
MLPKYNQRNNAKLEIIKLNNGKMLMKHILDPVCVSRRTIIHVWVHHCIQSATLTISLL